MADNSVCTAPTGSLVTLNFLLEVHLAVGLQGDSMKTNYNFCKIFLLIGAISLTNATRGFGQELRQRQPVGQLHAGQRLQDPLHLIAAAPRFHHQRL